MKYNSNQDGQSCVFNWRLFFFDVLYIGALFICVSRGYLEIYIGKTAAYGVQIVTWSIFLAILPIVLKVRWKSVHRAMIVYLALGFFAFFSSMLTLLMTGFEYGYIYATVTMYITAIFLYGNSVRPIFIKPNHFIDPLIIVTIVLVTVGYLQQLGFVELPGMSMYTILRPSSLTGSYLHYPIVIAVLTIIFVQAATILKQNRYIFMSILCSISVFFSLSRSGMMILVFSIIIYFFLYVSSLQYKIMIYVILKMLFLLLLFFCIVYFFIDNIFIIRFIGAFDIASEGNDSRAEIWLHAIDLLGFDTLFYGHLTGLYTNVTKNLIGVPSLVMESGFLQQIVSFGLIGALAFYGIIFGVFLSIDKSCIWLKAAVLAAILQSFVYQSTEVFPFIVLISLLPVISKVINYDLYNRLKHVRVNILL